MPIKYDLYLSSHYDSKDLAKEFYTKLVNEQNLRVCMNNDSISVSEHTFNISMINEMSGFICLFNKSYIESDECKHELKYAANNKIKIFLLRIENVKSNDLLKNDKDLLFILPFATFNFYDKFGTTDLDKNTFALLVKAIRDSFKSMESLKQSDRWETRLYKNGKYEGEIVNVIIQAAALPIHFYNVHNVLFKEKKHGIGIYYFDSGDVYDGCWLNDAQSGHGKYIYKNGDSYEGKRDFLF